ncbi:ribosomal protein L7/L12 [Streptomyces sp. NPDC089799]|uniref:ribosomal protein L7/L12 n=1 Tax=Streptomyces sp. NPDC089799 TaxID=3155066 RepID=UPI00342631A7
MLVTEAGDRKVEAVRAIRTVTGLSLWNSKLLLAGTPVEIAVSGLLDGAEEAARVLEEAGARTTLLCDCCGRSIRRGAFPINSTRHNEPWSLEICWASGQPSAI